MFGQKSDNLDVLNVNSKVDFTLLDPRATYADIERLCDIAYKNQYYAVCVNPIYVSYAKGYIAKNFNNLIKVVSVIGFPLGANKIDVKLLEAKQAIDDGADEIDVVINISMLKTRNYDYIKSEVVKLRKLAKKQILKIIIETCYLDENDIIKICKICSKAKADYVKTSTGFGTGGVTENVINILYRELSGKCKIKASGGIKSRAEAINLLNLGAERIGTSHII